MFAVLGWMRTLWRAAPTPVLKELPEKWPRGKNCPVGEEV